MREFLLLCATSLLQLGLRLVLAFTLYIKNYPMKIFELISLPFSYLAIYYWISCIYQAKYSALAKPVLMGSLSPQEELNLHLAALQYAQTLEKYRVVQSRFLTHRRYQLFLCCVLCCPLFGIHVLNIQYHH
jgi:hypothetical protein